MKWLVHYPIEVYGLRARPEPRRLIADPEAEVPMARALRGTGGPFLVAIGPEGGFTPDEIRVAAAAGFAPIRLTEAVLRTDAAAVTAMALLAAGCGGEGPAAEKD